MPLTQDQADELFHAICEKFEKFNSTPEDMLNYIAHLLIGTLAKNGTSQKNANAYLDELKDVFRIMKKNIEKKSDPFLDHLQQFFDQNEEKTQQALKILLDNPNEDGMLFSKEFREKMSKFGDMDCADALKSRDFWKELASYGGISDEEFEKITTRDNQ